MHFWQFKIQALDLQDFGKLLFWPCCVLSHNNSIKQEGKQKTKEKKKKKKLALALSLLKHHGVVWVGLGAMYVNACNFHNKQVHKELHSVQVITEPQSSRNFLLDIKNNFY